MTGLKSTIVVDSTKSIQIDRWGRITATNYTLINELFYRIQPTSHTPPPYIPSPGVLGPTWDVIIIDSEE